MKQSAIASEPEDRVAIERWEGEGGRAFRHEESLPPRPREVHRSDSNDGVSVRAPSPMPASERARSS
jgi:hypothetical protein